MVTRVDALFLVDRQRRQHQLSVEERLAQRREHAESWAAEIHDACVMLSKTTLDDNHQGRSGDPHFHQPMLRPEARQKSSDLVIYRPGRGAQMVLSTWPQGTPPISAPVSPSVSNPFIFCLTRSGTLLDLVGYPGPTQTGSVHT